MVKILVILGSTRPNRFGPQPAEWLMQQTKKVDGAEFELIDLAKINLPLLDEPLSPFYHDYSKDHTKKWSKIIDAADGFVFVTAEYNHSIPAALKNAIDFLFDEWNYKPASFMSYGSNAGGARAVEHLRAVCGELRMFDLREQLVMQHYKANSDDQGRYKFTPQQVELAQQILTQTVFWAQKLKPIRQELTKNKS